MEKDTGYKHNQILPPGWFTCTYFYTEVTRSLSFMQTEEYMSDYPALGCDVDNWKLSVDLVRSFDSFMNNKFLSSSDAVMHMLINFVQMVTQYNF